MGNLINIAFLGGTHGNFLKYIIDRFSQLTPSINESPFTKLGTSHVQINYSGKVNSYHPRSGWQNVDEPHIIIKFDKDDVLYITRMIYARAGDINTDWNEDYIKFPNIWHEWFDEKNKIQKLYNKKIDQDTLIPKSIMRDFFKMSFLDIENHGVTYFLKHMMKNHLENVYYMNFNNFYNKENFIKELEEINKKFNLDIKLDDNFDHVYEDFIKGISLKNTRSRAYDVYESLKNGKNVEIELDCIEEAWLNAKIEEENKFIVMPNVNQYFKTTSDIASFIEWYPNHYKAMNPNLPKFNDIPNPYYLHKSKK